MKPNQKLELTWIGKGQEPKLEPRILIEQPEYSYGDPDSGNMLIQGDNLLALKALEQEYAGKVKCIYIDPPYNTGSAFEHYDDNLEHSIWLNLMNQRIVFLRNLISMDGFFCCHIDDSEGQYLKVLLDEIFGRKNYLTTLFVRVRYPDKTLKQDMDFHKEIEQVHVYRKEYGAKPNLNQSELSFDKFCFFISELSQGKEVILGGKRVVVFQKGEYVIEKKSEGNAFGLKEIWATGSILDGNSSGRFFRDNLTGRYEIDGLGVLYKVYGIGDDRYDYRYFTGPQRLGATKGKYFQGVPVDNLNSENKITEQPINNFYDLASSFGNCRTEGGVGFRGGKKPEMLLSLILRHFSNEGDLVLDSFLGSGTTAAVAQKMGRKWIGIELGDHAKTHCVPRLKQVIAGSDQGGISKAVEWQGGGGFKFYTLAPSLLNKDKYDNWIISKEYNPDMLAAAMAKQSGFRYEPDGHVYWKQGRSSEKDYIYTTTQFMTVEMLEKIREEMGPDESLMICAKIYQRECENRFPNITVKKIPQMLLGKCEFGKEDYSLNIVNLPHDDVAAPSDDEAIDERIDENPGNEPASQSAQTNLFY